MLETSSKLVHFRFVSMLSVFSTTSVFTRQWTLPLLRCCFNVAAPILGKASVPRRHATSLMGESPLNQTCTRCTYTNEVQKGTLCRRTEMTSLKPDMYAQSQAQTRKVTCFCLESPVTFPPTMPLSSLQTHRLSTTIMLDFLECACDSPRPQHVLNF